MPKAITFIIPEELHEALLLKQSEMHVNSKTRKKTPLRLLIPKLLAKALNTRLPEGWEEHDKKSKGDKEVE